MEAEAAVMRERDRHRAMDRAVKRFRFLIFIEILLCFLIVILDFNFVR